MDNTVFEYDIQLAPSIASLNQEEEKLEKALGKIREAKSNVDW